jgi:hypothetical protein
MFHSTDFLYFPPFILFGVLNAPKALRHDMQFAVRQY